MKLLVRKAMANTPSRCYISADAVTIYKRAVECADYRQPMSVTEITCWKAFLSLPSNKLCREGPELLIQLSAHRAACMSVVPIGDTAWFMEPKASGYLALPVARWALPARSDDPAFDVSAACHGQPLAEQTSGRQLSELPVSMDEAAADYGLDMKAVRYESRTPGSRTILRASGAYSISMLGRSRSALT